MTPTNELPDATSGCVNVTHGTRLHDLEAGAGPHLLLVVDWSQAAAQWRKQIEALSQAHHVVAVDMRGHGEFAKPARAVQVARARRRGDAGRCWQRSVLVPSSAGMAYRYAFSAHSCADGPP